jgi:ABC-type branched-subunit amino acid transport system substrate-binding protein
LELVVNRKYLAVLAAAVAGTMVLSACSSGKSGGGSGGSGGGDVTVGLLYDVTGTASSNYTDATIGVKARIAEANAAAGSSGRQIKLEIGDSASTPAGALAAAKKLIEINHVQTIMSWTPFAYGAASYVQQKNVPMIGGAWDSSPLWRTADNMFGSAQGPYDPKAVAATWGDYFKSKGVTKVATVSTNSPAATAAAASVAKSAQAAGLPVVYTNSSATFDQKDFSSIALALKSSGADGVYAPFSPAQMLGFATSLSQQGVKTKVILAATGYGKTLLDNATARTQAEGVSYVTSYAPVEINTPATQQWVKSLQQYGSYTGSPTFNVAGTWIEADLLVKGLAKVSGSADAASIETGIKSITDFTADGILAKPGDLSKKTIQAGGLGWDNCIWVSTVKSGKFVPENPDPYCGSLLAS